MYRVNLHGELSSMTIQTHDKPTYIFNVEVVSDEKLWFYGIKCFLEKKEYPLGACNKDRKTLRRLPTSFFLNGDVLYKRNIDMVLLKCVDKYKVDMLMVEVHEGSFGTHANGYSMERKMLKASYYW